MSLKNPTTPGLLIDGQWSKAWSHSCRNTMWSRHGSKCWGHGFIYYIFMYVLNMYTETRQARKFNPAYALQETTSNAWDLPGRVTPDMGQITQVSIMAAWHNLGHCFGHAWFLLDLKLSSFLLGLFIFSHSHMNHGVWTINQIWSFTPKTWLFLKKNSSPIDEQCEESYPFGWYIVTHQPENKGHVRMIPLRNQRHDVMVRPL